MEAFPNETEKLCGEGVLRARAHTAPELYLGEPLKSFVDVFFPLKLYTVGTQDDVREISLQDHQPGDSRHSEVAPISPFIHASHSQPLRACGILCYLSCSHTFARKIRRM